MTHHKTITRNIINECFSINFDKLPRVSGEFSLCREVLDSTMMNGRLNDVTRVSVMEAIDNITFRASALGYKELLK